MRGLGERRRVSTSRRRWCASFIVLGGKVGGGRVPVLMKRHLHQLPLPRAGHNERSCSTARA